jgi:Ohr subfamily peroxiredoxin
MSALSQSPTRRGLLATTTAALAVGLLPAPLRASAEADDAIRPFRIAVPEPAFIDLRRRLSRWPDRETVADRSQGAQLAKIQALAGYWETDYDWRKVEARLNAMPQFVTKIDGLDIQFAHIRSRHADAMPLIMTHGWPGSIIELLGVVARLTDPTAHGGRAEDAFHLVLPSMPGYGFSGKPQATGWGPDRIARAWTVLMQRLGYQHHVSQGGDWGSVVSDVMARHAPAGLLGIHVNMPATVPPEIAKALADGEPPPQGLSAAGKAAYQQLNYLYTKGSGYAGMMVTRPQTVGYGLEDSPTGLAAWFYDKFADWTYSGGDPERSLIKDAMLDDISLYWFTNTATSSARLYRENNANNFNAVDISIPAGSACFEGAMALAAHKMKITLPPDLAIDAEVDLCRADGGFFLQARLNVSLPGLEREVARSLTDAAHQTCPYSKAIRGNIDVVINLV